jgi:hypothetical protein
MGAAVDGSSTGVGGENKPATGLTLLGEGEKKGCSQGRVNSGLQRISRLPKVHIGKNSCV